MRNNPAAFLPLVALLAASCRASTAVTAVPEPPRAAGPAYARSNAGVAETFDQLDAALQSNSAIGIVARVDHSVNASSVGMTLRPTRVILFGNPTLGTPLMQRSQAAGIDLPQPILVYQNTGGEVFAAYNTTDYLASRHGLEGVATLPMLAAGLKMLVENATAASVSLPESKTAPAGAGLIIRQSGFSVDETIARLKGAVTANPALRIVAEVDHAAAAVSVGLTLRPTKLLVFGNPRLGTPLLQSRQSIGIDLPQPYITWAL
jgi:uncharacterized protein (DUF302 family)